MLNVTVVNLHPRRKIAPRFIGSFARRAARLAGLRTGQIGIVFTDARRIRSLNRRFRKSDRATDVLAFDLGAGADGRGPRADIVISLDAARRNAKRFGASFGRETLRYVVHGILHLAGFDDGTPADSARMRRKEDRLLGRLCSTERFSRVSTSR